MSRQLMREIDHLSVDETKWLNELVEEALRDLHKKAVLRRGPGVRVLIGLLLFRSLYTSPPRLFLW
jgi:hypothetical protein